MNHDTLVGNIQRAFKDFLAQPLPNYDSNTVTPTVQYDNTKVDPPDPAALPANTVFIRFTVKPGDSRQKTMGPPGNRLFRKHGIAIAQIRTPADIGTGLNDHVVHEMENYFSGVTRYGVVFRAVSPQPGRQDGDNWLVNVHLPFFADRIA